MNRFSEPTSRPDHKCPVPAPTGRTIELALSGPDAVARASDAPIVAPVLSAPRSAACTIDFGRFDGRTYRFPAKLVPWVTGDLVARDVRVTLRCPVPTAPAHQEWGATSPVVRALLGGSDAAVWGGLVPRDGAPDPMVLAPELLRLFPGRRVFVAAPTRRDVGAWFRHLAGADPGRPVFTVEGGPGAWHHPASVLVGSFEALDRCRADDFGLALVTDVAPLRARPLVTRRRRPWGPMEWTTFRLLRDHRVPAFGFVPSTGSPLSGAELLTLMSWFGPPLFAPRREPRVRVRVVAVPQGAAPLPADLLAAKRTVWTDVRRNDAVARLAGAAEIGAPRAIGVLTASPVQAAEIAARLPGWELVPNAIDGPATHRFIVTEGWLDRGRFGSGTVIDARGWGPLAPGDFAPGDAVELIDVPATGHPEFRRRAAARLADYRRYGWAIDGTVDPVPDPVAP